MKMSVDKLGLTKATLPYLMRIVALSGSLRRESSNSRLLRAYAAVAPAGIEVEIFEAAGELPPFNPDLDGEGDVPPPAVAAFRKLLGEAGAFVISSPEYAHGLPGAFKNALDWIVSSGELGGKPVALINPSASTSGQYARRDLIDTLTVMGANVLREACLDAPIGQGSVDADGRISNPEVLRKLKASLAVLVAAQPEPSSPSDRT